MCADRPTGCPWAVVLLMLCFAGACGPAESRVAPGGTGGLAAVAQEAPGETPAGRGGGAAPAPPETPVVAAKAPAVGDGKVREISFDDLTLPLEKGAPYTPAILPPAVDALQGQSVRIRGYILPSFQQRGITQFVLVRDNMECCFGPGALLHDCVVVRMRPGKSADFSIRPVAVAGSFRIEELKGPDGKHLAIYGIDGDAVE
ncbi:MAG: DUF3299 domain-containing protein [Planctomycetota bacterium]|nr:MAG: DUF3299 domain-containing protein [Planctomycetota bacterium]